MFFRFTWIAWIRNWAVNNWNQPSDAFWDRQTFRLSRYSWCGIRVIHRIRQCEWSNGDWSIRCINTCYRVLHGYERDIFQHLVPLVRSEMHVLRNEGVQMGNDWNVWRGEPPFAVRILPPKSPSEIEFRATVDFQSSQLAERVAERLDQLGHSFALRIDNQWVSVHLFTRRTSIFLDSDRWAIWNFDFN